MIQATMNPDALNHLSRKVEFNLFAEGMAASNNLLSIQDFRKEDELYDLAFSKFIHNGPIMKYSESPEGLVFDKVFLLEANLY